MSRFISLLDPAQSATMSKNDLRLFPPTCIACRLSWALCSCGVIRSPRMGDPTSSFPISASPFPAMSTATIQTSSCREWSSTSEWAAEGCWASAFMMCTMLPSTDNLLRRSSTRFANPSKPSALEALDLRPVLSEGGSEEPPEEFGGERKRYRTATRHERRPASTKGATSRGCRISIQEWVSRQSFVGRANDFPQAHVALDTV